jgi:hypothetical protein
VIWHEAGGRGRGIGEGKACRGGRAGERGRREDLRLATTVSIEDRRRQKLTSCEERRHVRVGSFFLFWPFLNFLRNESV